MPKSPAKEERELWALKKFRELYSVPDGPVDSSEESPDLVIHASSCRVGIEVTDIQPENGKGGSSVMREASERAGVMRTLKSLLRKSNTPPILVSYHGDLPERSPTGRDDLAARLARYIKPRIPPVGEVFSKCVNHWPYDPELPPECFALTIARYRYLTEISCNSGEAVFIPDLSIADVERCVAKKDGKVGAYRDRCDEPWLLMCVNTVDLATAYSLESFNAPPALPTEFDRLFVLSALDRRVYLIPRGQV
jgi:hypothetical protein